MSETVEERLDAAIVSLVSRGAIVVPPYPAAAQRLNQLVSQDDFSLLEMAKVIETDQRLSADILHCANSAAFNNTGEEIASLNTAIVRIGAQMVVRIALTSGLAAYICKPGPFTQLRQRVWRQALIGAIVSQALARTRSRDIFEGEAFLCGLLHDIGESITLSCIETILDTWTDFEPQPYEFWNQVLNKYHVEVGLVVAEQWSLPEMVKTVISSHHGGFVADEFEDMTRAIQVSDRVARLLENNPRLSVDDLANIEGLIDADERWRIANALVAVPDIVANLAPAAPTIRQRPPGKKRPARGGATGRATKAQASATPAPPPLPPPVREARRTYVMAVPPPPPPTDEKTTAPKYLFQVQNLQKNKAERYKALAIEGSELTVVGPKPMAENALLRLCLEVTPKPLTIWAKVKWSLSDDGKLHKSAVMPFALNGPDFDQWVELVKEHKPVAE